MSSDPGPPTSQNQLHPSGDDKTRIILLRRYRNTCLNCRVTGHTHVHCPLRPCYICKQKGHFATDCQYRLKPGVYQNARRQMAKDGISMYKFINQRQIESTLDNIDPKQIRFPNDYFQSKIGFIGRAMHSKRITCAEWSPTGKHILTGDKTGDIRLWSLNEAAFEESLEYSSQHITVNQLSNMFYCNVRSFVFHPFQEDTVFAASLDGTVSSLGMNCVNNTGKKSNSNINNQSVYQSYFHFKLNDPDRTPTSPKFEMPYGMQFDKGHYCLYIGTSNGMIMRLDPRENNKINTKMAFHKDKVTCIDVNVSTSELLVSSSNDRTIKLWDARKFHPKHSIGSFLHSRVVSSAYFSPMSGSKLMTTSLDNKIRIWHDLNVLQWNDNNSESNPLEIVHSHNFHRHLNAFKAVWDPKDIKEDLILCGRFLGDAYGGEDEEKDSILHPLDLFSAKTGNLIDTLVDPSFTFIQPITKFAPNTNFILSAASSHVALWTPPARGRKRKDKEPRKRSTRRQGGRTDNEKDDDSDDDDNDSDDDSGNGKKLRKVTVLSAGGTSTSSKKTKKKVSS